MDIEPFLTGTRILHKPSARVMTVLQCRYLEKGNPPRWRVLGRSNPYFSDWIDARDCVLESARSTCDHRIKT